MRFMFCHSHGLKLLVDFQGFWQRGIDRVFVLVDAQAHSVMPKDFWDKGVEALKSFTAHHTCNTLCEAMDLDDITNYDFDKVIRSAQQLHEPEDVSDSP